MANKTATAKKEAAPIFRGTVAELAGKISLNGEVLNLQDVQFLTRIGRDSFAKPVGTAPGTGTRGGKRATVWEINPNCRLAFEAAPVNDEKQETKGKGASTASQKAPAVDPKVLEAAVSEAVQKVLSGAGSNDNGGKQKRHRRTKAEMQAAREQEQQKAA